MTGAQASRLHYSKGTATETVAHQSRCENPHAANRSTPLTTSERKALELHPSASDDCVRTEMNTSRIEIPLTLPPPHFDDDATIATARQVVPIKGGRRSERRRKVLALLPILLASTLCGALGAIAVNYFERRRDTAATVTQQPQPGVSTQAKTDEPSTVAGSPELNAKQTETQDPVVPAGSIASADEPSRKSDEPKVAKGEDAEPKPATPAPATREASQDAAKLVRKRRVQPADSEAPLRRNRRTASRIEDLFTGPNP